MQLSGSNSELEIIKTCFNLKEQDGCLILKLRGPTLYIFKPIDLKTLPEIQPILKDYLPPQYTNQAIRFRPIPAAQDISHGPLKSKLTQLLQRYKICIPVGMQDRGKIAAIQKSLCDFSRQIKIYVRTESHHNSNLIIYFPHDIQDIQMHIQLAVNHMDAFKRHELVYPLNYFISKAIDHSLHGLFVDKIIDLYRQQIKAIPRREYLVYKFLKITTVKPAYIPASDRNSQWHKQESKGIYGIQLAIEGLDYQIIRLYSSLQTFFTTKHYSMKNLSEEVDKQSDLAKKQENPMLDYVYLTPKQCLIFGPPQYYESAALDIEKRQWTITMQSYPDMPFELLKKREKRFRRQLAERRVFYEEMRVAEKQLTFISDKKNYEKLKYHAKDFLTNNLYVDIKVDFIFEKHEFQCLKHFILLKDAFLCQLELYWRDDVLFFCCPKEKAQETYNQLKFYHQQCKKQMKSIISPKPIVSPFVKVIQNPDDLQPESLITKKLVSPNFEFEITFQDYMSSSVDYAVLMLFDPQNKQELEQLFEQKFQLLENPKTPFNEKSLSNCKQLKSILVWNCSRDYEHNQRYLSQRRCRQLLKVVDQKAQLVFFVTRGLYQSGFEDFLYLLTEIPNHQHKLCYNVTIILADNLSKHQKQAIYKETASSMQSNLSQTPRYEYRMSLESMQIANRIKFYQLQLQYKGKSYNSSNLNSFVFGIQKDRVQSRRGSRGNNECAVILPKVSDLQQILVDLRSFEAFTIQNQKAKPFHLHQRKLLSEMTEAIKALVPQQNLILIYSKKGEDNGPSSIYVYKEGCKNELRRFVLERQEGKFIFIPYQEQYTRISFRKCNEDSRYRLETHAQYIQELKRLIE